MSHIKISVIVPVYKVPETYLIQCLESLKNQHNFNELQIIVVDDGSPEKKLVQICDRYADDFLILHKQNGGVSTARNLGMEHATGEWIAFVDSDDWCEPAMFQDLLQYADQQTVLPDIVVCNCFVNMRDRQVINPFYAQTDTPFVWNQQTKETTLLQIMGRNTRYNAPEIAIGVPWAKLYRKEFLTSNSLQFEPELKRMQDNIFNLYAFDDAKSVAYLKKPLYHYRKFEDSRSNKYSPEVVSDFEKVLRWNKRFLARYPSNTELKQGYYSRVLQSFHAYMRFWLFNPQNTMKYTEKKQIIKELMKREPYAEAFAHIDLRHSNSSLAIMILLLKCHCFRILGAMVAFRQQAHKAQQ